MNTHKYRPGLVGSVKLTKREWYSRGGFSNPRCWRRDRGGWQHFYRFD